jgi:D-lactate dehydrogenase
MPKSAKQPKSGSRVAPKLSKMDKRVVYFPSCINQTMGLAKGAPVKNSLVDEMVKLCNKAGYTVIFPKGIDKMCCGTIWESK